MSKNDSTIDAKDDVDLDRHRRDFLRNSVYAAYATPLITLLLVDAQSAAASPGCPPPCRRPNPPPGLKCRGCD